jgi:prevent-host-death family protein
MATKIVTVSELKTKLAGVMAELEAGGVPVYVTQHGKPKAVLVQYVEYEALLERLDDLEDALAMQQALASPPDEAVSLEEYERQRAPQVPG